MDNRHFAAARFRRRIAATCALVAASVLAVVVPTGAVTQALAAVHINLSSSMPAKDSHVTTPLREIRLRFSGTVDVTRAHVRLLASDGRAVALGTLTAVADSSTVAVSRVSGTLAPGTYTVEWDAVAADGAQGEGAFNFMYMPTPAR